VIRGLVREFRLPDSAVRQVDEGLDRQPDVLCAAVEAGIPVLAGTDAGVGPHGRVAHEVMLLCRAGLPPEVALGAASWTARAWLGHPGVEEGAPADLVAYRDDPRSDVEVLALPALVLLDGRPVRDDR
jgi:imidazolonepropionase-like amidohydrolase